jgi:truncated hemoglobin YjbI
MMKAHAHLDLKPEDYSRWLDLFHLTIDENFQGEKAQMAKDRSFGIGMTMKYALSKKP